MAKPDPYTRAEMRAIKRDINCPNLVMPGIVYGGKNNGKTFRCRLDGLWFGDPKTVCITCRKRDK